MKISSNLNSHYPSFKSATININVFSDTHGNLKLANNALEEMRSRKEDIFCNQDKGTKNILAICGDWFINGSKKGFSSNPDKESAKFQLDILNGFIAQLQKITPIDETFFTIGNHEFDGGVKLLDEILDGIDAQVLVSNIDISNSEGLTKSISDNKIINEKVVECSDDQNSSIKHKILFLGICPVNMQYYQNDMEGVTLLDNVKKMQKNVEKQDYKNTLDYCKNRITDFKEQNPNGLVVFFSHTGVNFADNLAREAPVNIIFDGHEHGETIRTVNGVPIVPLSQNFKKIVNAKLHINNEGKNDSIKIESINPLKNKTKGVLYDLYCKIFQKDIEKKYSIRTSQKDITTLDVTDIREKNNYLANFITDGILSELKKRDNSVDFFALNSSSIRHSLKLSQDKPEVSDLDIMNVLAGIKEDEGEILTTEVTGKQLTYMILDNFIFNKDTPQKNPLIHYSGLIIDRTNMLKDYQNGINYEHLTKYIIDAKTNKPIISETVYKIANAKKYFNKTNNPLIKAMKENSEHTGISVHLLLRDYFKNNRDNLYAKCDERIK